MSDIDAIISLQVLSCGRTTPAAPLFMLFRTASFQLAHASAHSYARVSELEARGPEDYERATGVARARRSYSTVTLFARLRG